METKDIFSTYMPKKVSDEKKKLRILLLDLDGTAYIYSAKDKGYILNQSVLEFAKHFDLVIPFSARSKSAVLVNIKVNMGSCETINTWINILLTRKLHEGVEKAVGREKVPFVALTPDALAEGKSVGSYFQDEIIAFEQDLLEIVSDYLTTNSLQENSVLSPEQRYAIWNAIEAKYKDEIEKPVDKKLDDKKALFQLVRRHWLEKHDRNILNFTAVDDHVNLYEGVEGLKVIEAKDEKIYAGYLFGYVQQSLPQAKQFSVNPIAKIKEEIGQLQQELIDYIIKKIKPGVISSWQILFPENMIKRQVARLIMQSPRPEVNLDFSDCINLEAFYNAKKKDKRETLTHAKIRLAIKFFHKLSELEKFFIQQLEEEFAKIFIQPQLVEKFDSVNFVNNMRQRLITAINVMFGEIDELEKGSKETTMSKGDLRILLGNYRETQSKLILSQEPQSQGYKQEACGMQ